MPQPHIDLNADAGESFGVWVLGHDADLFALVSSVNLACGFHAGDPATMRQAAHLAAEHGVAVGAHPGYPDRRGFGRRSLAASPGEIFCDTLYQLGALHAVLRAEGLTLSHVKAHGALYLDMARDESVAAAVAAAVAAFDPALPLVALAGPGGEVMRRAAATAGLTVINEAFPDRAYAPDGHLAPRSVSGGCCTTRRLSRRARWRWRGARSSRRWAAARWPSGRTRSASTATTRARWTMRGRCGGRSRPQASGYARPASAAARARTRNAPHGAAHCASPGSAPIPLPPLR